MSLVVRARAGNGTAELSRIAGDLGLTVAWQANKGPGGLRAFRCPRRVAGSTIAHYAVATKQDRAVSSDRCNTRVVRELRWFMVCLLYTSPSPRDGLLSRMPSSA